MDFNELAVQAMKQGKRIKLSYHGEERLVEVHALGTSTKGKPCTRVFQVVGGSVFSATSGWKMLSVADIDDPQLVDDASLAPRPGFNPGDRGMSSIIMEVSDEPVPSEAPAPSA